MNNKVFEERGKILMKFFKDYMITTKENEYEKLIVFRKLKEHKPQESAQELIDYA